ncbi:hypothetical protein HPB51_017189 [Rhipicephalus microplus]|uniref:Uncharacterized protein n=1 Tax=Rhipicephalus microplus TaxID=6941 RepID=A0A9J6EAZ0_RHIMP|nr:hypothetical protein HPB51_017189 [Rhipicephalus microplus]
MKISCLRSKQFPDHDICTLYAYLFDILEEKNVSLVYQFHSDWSMMFYDLYCENTDIVVLIMPLHENILATSTYSEIKFAPEIFYTAEGKIEAPSLLDTTLRSALTVTVTAASLIICVGLLLVVGGNRLKERVQTETLFLFALFLARSTPFPRANRRPRVQNVVYLFWALAMFPLSQYFQGELTSMVTVGRPADILDTHQELEAALDAGIAAPCVTRESASLVGIQYWDHPTKLGQKLRTSLIKHQDKLVTADLRSCFDCATRSGSVCYGPRMPPSFLKRIPHRVVAFGENFMTRAFSMPLRKSFPLRDSYRAFLQRLTEQGLLGSPYCKYATVCQHPSRVESPPQTEKPLLELHGFVQFYAVMLAGTPKRSRPSSVNCSWINHGKTEVAYGSEANDVPPVGTAATSLTNAVVPAKRGISDFGVLIHGHSVTALIDTEDYSVISGSFNAKLDEVKTAWS